MADSKNYAWTVSTSSKEVYDYFTSMVQRMGNELRQKEIVVFGAGIRGTLLAIILERLGYSEFCFTDNNNQKWGGNINGHAIVPVEEICQKRGKVFILIALEGCQHIVEQLKDKAFVQESDFVSLDTSLYSLYMNEFHRKTNGKILLMGDCGMTHISLEEKKKQNMAEILKDKLGESSIKILAMHGMGMGAYYHILKTYGQIYGYPKVMVLMTNFEVFTGKQHLLPRSQHVELLRMVHALRPEDNEFRAYIEQAEQRAQNLQVEIVGDKIGDYIERAKLYIRLNYMYRLRTENENIQYLRKILQLLQEKKVNVITFIPPVNYQLAGRLELTNFKERYEANVGILTGILSEYDCKILNLAYLLTENEFAATMTVDETANYAGRYKQAEQIIRAVQEVEHNNR